jgi:hypothetical protein
VLPHTEYLMHQTKCMLTIEFKSPLALEHTPTTLAHFKVMSSFYLEHLIF